MSNGNFPIDKPVIIMVGPTAVGKTALSLHIAEKHSCEIVSLDSMQVYKFMDIGTAKATKEERKRISHHLIDVVNPDEHYDAKRYAEDAFSAINSIHDNNKIPLVTGGTGLYLKALLEGLFEDIGEYPLIRQRLRSDLEQLGSSKLHEVLSSVDCSSAERIHKNDSQRITRALEIYYGTGKPWSEHLAEQQHQKNANKDRFGKILMMGLTCQREALYRRINRRTKQMIEQGLADEVEGLLKRGYSKDLKPMQAIGYKHMICHLTGEWSFEKMQELLARDTRRYAKRQYTWFKKNNLEWFEVSKEKDILKRINSFLLA